MSKITTFELLEMSPDQEAARVRFGLSCQAKDESGAEAKRAAKRKERELVPPK